MDSVRSSRVSLKSDAGGKSAQAYSVASKLTYIVEQCESQFDNTFKEMLRTTAGEGTINHLEPGKSYRFRVFARNIDGGEGPKSETAIVHALLETPQAPTVVQKWPTANITATSIALQWRDRRHGVTSRDKGVIKRMIGDWTGAGEESGGVSIESAFAKYDRDGNGEMDISEFAYLLADLGVECSKERLDFVFNEFDSNTDGVISFPEFSAFWRRDEVTYTLKRSEPIPFLPIRDTAIKDGVGAKRVGSGLSKTLNSTHSKSGVLSKTAGIRQPFPATATDTGRKSYKDVPTPVTSYRAGTGKVFEERGLLPNQLYYFKLRYVGSRVNSQLSAPLVIMSAPLPPPAAPAVIRYSGTSVKLKWYPPQHGAFKFEVQLFTVSCPTGSTSQEWSVVYSGQENTFMTTTLAPDSVYKARVLALNYQGTPSAPSEVVTFRTLPRSENSLNLTTKNVSSSFTIECVEDICVGDIILMTERLFAKEGSSVADDGGRGGVGTQGSVRLDRGVRMDMSVTSFTGQQPAPGAFIGERTIACHVARDNYRTYRESKGNNHIDAMRFCRSRRLWLEVIWEQSSTPACKQYKLNPGTIIERTQSHFEQFEVFRTVWTHEEARLPFNSEINSLAECFLIPDL